MSENMKTVLPNAKFYNFSRKFWQVTAYLELGGGAQGARNFTGGRGPPGLLGTAPGSWSRGLELTVLVSILEQQTSTRVGNKTARYIIVCYSRSYTSVLSTVMISSRPILQ